jgi:hypothetical protein
MSRLEPSFRRRIVELSAQHGFVKRESRMSRLVLHRATADGVSQEVWLSAQDVFVAEGQPLAQGISIWAFIVFPALESVIGEALRLIGAEPGVTDMRSARFSLRSLLGPSDPPCMQGLQVDEAHEPETQAEAVWSFYWERAAPHFARLSSPEILSDLGYMPPGTSHVAWATRQLLYHANRGDFEVSKSIGLGIEKTASAELTSSLKGLMTAAAAGAHQFAPPTRALDYRSHPLWLEFTAVQSHASRIA